MKTKVKKNYNVVALYDHMGYKKNEPISAHATYELAERAVKRGPMPSFRGIRLIGND